MTDSTETAAPVAAKIPPGYTADGPRSATFDASPYGYGVLTFGEPTYGRFTAFHRAQYAGDEQAEAMLLRAFVRRATGTGFPKADEPLKKWVDFVAEQPLSSMSAVIFAASYFSNALAAEIKTPGNG